MPLYQFDCRTCDQILEVSAPMRVGAPPSVVCPDCHQTITRRLFNIAVLSPFVEHFNHTVGKPVRTMAEFKGELNRASEEAEARTGIPHRYVPVEGVDSAAAAGIDRDSSGVIGAGMDNTNRRRVAAGQRKTKFIST